jgi:uncharacterized Rossmann fold enzyme
MKPLEIVVQAAGEPEELCSNIRASLARGLSELAPAPIVHDGTFVCVASGWSMPSFIDEIKEHRKTGRPIVAIKAAHDFLCENGVKPDLWVNLDPRDRTSGIKHHNEHTTYLVASRCPPVTFDTLKDRKVLLWHSWSEGPEMQAMGAGKLAIGGGTTSGMRAINIGYILGFRKFVLYGYDSCNRADGIKRFTGEMTGPTMDVYVGDGPEKRKFICNAAMAQQANEFQMIYAVMPDISVEAKGPGLIAAIIDERRKMSLAA